MKVYYYFFGRFENLMFEEYEVSCVIDVKNTIRLIMKGYWRVDIKASEFGKDYFFRKLNETEVEKLKHRLLSMKKQLCYEEAKEEKISLQTF